MKMPVQKRSRASPAGFTLIELLVVIAVIGILAGLILPALARAKQKAAQTKCLSNFKQLGAAIQMYTDDNDDTLPGPLPSGIRASYDKKASQELAWFLAGNLSWPEASSVPVGKPLIIDVFLCPGYLRYAPGANWLKNAKCLLLNDNIGKDSNPANYVHPFGYPDFSGATDGIPPLKLSDLEKFGTPSDFFDITDVDNINVPNPTVSWQADIPDRPVHGQARNELYFDSHVAPKRVDF